MKTKYKFNVGDKIVVNQVSNPLASRELIGAKGTILAIKRDIPFGVYLKLDKVIAWKNGYEVYWYVDDREISHTRDEYLEGLKDSGFEI